MIGQSRNVVRNGHRVSSTQQGGYCILNLEAGIKCPQPPTHHFLVLRSLYSPLLRLPVHSFYRRKLFSRRDTADKPTDHNSVKYRNKMHNLAKSYLLLSLLPFAFADIVTQISDGQIQEPAKAPAVAAPKIAIAATSAPTAIPPPPTTASTSTPALKPSSAPAAAPKEAGAIASPPKANSTIPAPAKIQEAGTTAPILIAPAANITAPKHQAQYAASQPSASVGMMPPAENGTAPTMPTIPSLAPTSVEGSPREAGATNAVATGTGGRVGVSGWVGAVGLVGLVVMLC